MSIQPRGKSYQAYVSVDGHKARKSFTHLADAELWEAQARHALKRGLMPPTHINSDTGVSSAWSLGRSLDEAYETLWEGTKSEDHVPSTMRCLTKWFGHKTPVSKVDTQLIKGYVQMMKKQGRSGGTINRHLSCLRQGLLMAVDNNQLSELPKIHRQKEANHSVKWYRPEQEKLLLDTLLDMGENYIHDAAVVSLDTGMRASELLKFDPTPIPIGNKWGLMIPDRKNGDDLLLPVTERVLECVERTTFDKHPKQFRKRWQKLRNRTNMQEAIWKTFRSTCCSKLVMGGMDIFKVKEWMGHRNIQTTMKYAYLAPEGLLDGLNILEGK